MLLLYSVTVHYSDIARFSTAAGGEREQFGLGPLKPAICNVRMGGDRPLTDLHNSDRCVCVTGVAAISLLSF